MKTAAEVRADMMNALQLDLIGPLSGDARYAEEVLPRAPSKWYLTGFIVPWEAAPQERSDDTGDEQGPDEARTGFDDDKAPETSSARKAHFPSSMGLSVLVAKLTGMLQARVSWGDYRRVADTGVWRRVPRTEDVDVPLDGGEKPRIVPVPNSEGLELAISVRPAGGAGALPAGTRSVSVFLVNNRRPAPDAAPDARFAFQPELKLRCAEGFVPRPDLRSSELDSWDEQVADLQYADTFEYAVGHNVSAMALPGEGKCMHVRTCWIPSAEVEKVIPSEIKDVERKMETLASAPDAQALRVLVEPMLSEYASWRKQQKTDFPGRRGEVAKKLIENGAVAQERMRSGLAALDDPKAFRAFQIANRAVATAMRQRACLNRNDKKPVDEPPPEWRPFQLAFLLLNLAGIVDPKHNDRGVVDLLFFPTGGGKTEAYLGLAAFTLALRRLRDPSIRSSGVSVLMRYTLRLLTLDQLSRAATLICALELERQKDVQALGEWPLEIGLWVGQAATPNRMGAKRDKDQNTARARTLRYQTDPKHNPSPIPLESCPWCGWKFGADSFQLLPSPDAPEELRIFCQKRGCEFHARSQQNGLPIQAVDEPIYRRLPCFIIATVDKFASLPWVGETAGLFGRVDRADASGFYGPWRPGIGKQLGGPLPQPDLIIQDELHLISGPLGTIVGLYETAIDALCDRGGVRPKVIASTATVRQATRQIRALFGREQVDVFPPPGPDRRHSFFAETVDATQRNPRVYVGVAAQGRNLKVVLLRTYLALLASAQKAADAGDAADPYMTLLGYFNSLRELGGSRRIVEDEVKAQVADYGQKRRRVGETEGLFADRPRLREVAELTSRVSTAEVAETRRRLGSPATNAESIDVALATNMISVGLDETRLGLMVVLGQPKTAAEYIQATSRVGRDDARPGLVVTLMNVHRPRDRSHYERFKTWHDSFYRSVEATSVTPFSPRAIDRAIAAVAVALARLGNKELTPARGALEIPKHRQAAEAVADIIAARAERHDREMTHTEAEELRAKVRGRVIELLETWTHLAVQKGDLQYAREVGQSPPLLFDPLDPELERQPREARKFKAHRSMRDVEPTVNLWVTRPGSGT